MAFPSRQLVGRPADRHACTPVRQRPKRRLVWIAGDLCSVLSLFLLKQSPSVDRFLHPSTLVMADDVPANALPGFRASPDFDFLDADIIIRGTSGHSWYDDPEDEGTFFRVHKAKLSALSTTFRDMFALPTTPELSTAADGTLPQMQLPESAHELSLLLPFFYDDSTKYADADHLQTDELLKLWELADKYQVHLLPHLLKKDVM